MENRSDDRCTKTTGRTKTAAGITVYLLEELGDARMRCAQLKLLVAEAQKLVEKSTHRDHLFEVAAHLIHSIPDNLFRLEKALDAAAMSASRLDYEEIKQNLKPEKAEELEQVLSDARLRYLNRRSQQLASPKVALAEIERLASVTEQTGRVPVTELLVLAAALETGVKTASEAPSAAQQLRDIVTAAKQEKSRIALARSLRTFLADAMEPTAAHAMQALVQSASSREDVMEGFKDANPDLTDDQLKEIADQWEKNKDVVKDKAAMQTTSETELTAKFEEGKPADPTKQMSPEDAEKWEAMNDKYKDVVKDKYARVAKILDAAGTSKVATISKAASEAWQSYAPFFVDASSREKVMEGFKEANPKLTDEQLEEIADHWEKHKDVVKDKHKSASSAGDPLTGAWSAASSSGDDLG